VGESRDGLIVDDLDWLLDAACAAAGWRLSHFFVGPGETIRPEVAETCRTCPVRRDCLTHAYRWNLRAGYFGGMSPGRRRALGSLEAALAELDRDVPAPAG
jgi:hypothetical protein